MSRATNRKLYFVSGTSDSLRVQSLNPQSNEWSFRKWPCPEKTRLGFGITVIKKKLIIAGGKIDKKDTDSVECLDLDTMKWNDLPAMISPRFMPSIIGLKGDLYVVGGLLKGRATRSFEKYDFSTDEWHKMAPLPATVTNTNKDRVVALDGRLYVCSTLGSNLECYDPVTNTWKKIPHTNGNAGISSLAAVNKCLYAVGGYKSAAVERYDPSENSWTLVTTLRKEHRYNLRSTAMNDRLIVFYERDTSLELGDTIEEYNPESQEWTTLPSPLAYNRPFCHMFSKKIKI